MQLIFELEPKTHYRLIDYLEENQAWNLDELITQLLRQHFDEADRMKKSIEEQERKEE